VRLKNDGAVTPTEGEVAVMLFTFTQGADFVYEIQCRDEINKFEVAFYSRCTWRHFP